MTELPEQCGEGIGGWNLLSVEQVLKISSEAGALGVAEHPQRAGELVRGDGCLVAQWSRKGPGMNTF